MISRLTRTNVNANANYNNTLQLENSQARTMRRAGVREMERNQISDKISDDKLRFLWFEV